MTVILYMYLRYMVDEKLSLLQLSALVHSEIETL